jgi:hypothetical protein
MLAAQLPLPSRRCAASACVTLGVQFRVVTDLPRGDHETVSSDQLGHRECFGADVHRGDRGARDPKLARNVGNAESRKGLHDVAGQGWPVIVAMAAAGNRCRLLSLRWQTLLQQSRSVGISRRSLLSDTCIVHQSTETSQALRADVYATVTSNPKRRR